MTTTERPEWPRLVDRALGRDADGDEPRSVLLVDDLPGASLIWVRVRPLLRAIGLDLLRLDTRGGGQDDSAADDPFVRAAAIAETLDAQLTSPTIVVGHSLGAGVALALAIKAPHHVAGLVLAAPAAGSSAVSPTDRVLAAPILGPISTWFGFRTAGLALQIPVLRQRFVADPIGLSSAEAAEVSRRIVFGGVWRSFVVEQRQLVGNANQLQRHLRDVTCPAVVVAGARDRVVHPRVVNRLVRRLPHADLVVTDAGHLVPIDHPDAVVGAVLRLLQRHYRTSLYLRRNAGRSG